jgi:predicted DNA-binding protein YlxM (UPF0122 family)
MGNIESLARRLFGVRPKGAKAPAPAPAPKSDIDFRAIKRTLDELKQTVELKHNKAAEHRNQARECRRQNNKQGEQLHAGYMNVLQKQANEVDALHIKLDGLFEIVSQREITAKSVDHIRASLVFLQEHAKKLDVHGAEKLADDLADTIEQSRELTAAVASDPFNGGPTMSLREMDRLFAEDSEAPAPKSDWRQVRLDDKDSDSDLESESARASRVAQS